ncbi:hypothetical protein A2U01_0001138 [Trifolium medium]|uniref:Uncharacterized protein n=1 Tax=Trifolium medium TaxID=97028 RepID=A0A392LZE8_9FABA|nr:hypothetical protein [Trifolium medium]
MSSDNDSSLEQFLNIRFSKEERCCSPFLGKDFLLERLFIVRDTREMGSNRSFSKLITIPSPPICKPDSALRFWIPHPVTCIVVLGDCDSILINRNLGGRQPPSQHGNKGLRVKLSREVRVSIR